MVEAVQGEISTKADVRETEMRLEAKIEASKAQVIKRTFGTLGLRTIVILCAVVA